MNKRLGGAMLVSVILIYPLFRTAISNNQYAADTDIIGSAEIGSTAISAPLGRFLLMMKHNHVCAIKFTKYGGGQDDASADYEWYFQGDGSFDLKSKNTSSGHGQLRWKVNWIEELIWGPHAKSKVECGSFKVLWTPPTHVTFASFNTSWMPQFDDALELAPTKSRELGELDIRNPRLEWYKLSNDRQGRFIPIEQLP